MPSTKATPRTETETTVTLWPLFKAFTIIGIMSFGGGLAAWIRREVVTKRGWLNDKEFLTGYALSQIIPGANSPNIAVFIGSRLRGIPGALTAWVGLMGVPTCLLFTAGYFYLRAGGLGLGWMLTLFAGMGAAAIGMTLAMGIDLGRRGLTRAPEFVVVALVIICINIFHLSLIYTLLALIPASFVITWPRTKINGPPA